MKEKSNTIVSKPNIILLSLLFCVIFTVSIIICLKGTMEDVYVYTPIAFLSMIGIVILRKN